MSSRSGKRARPPTKGESLSDNERKKSTRSRLDDEVFVGNGGDETGYFSSGSDEGAASLQRGASSAATAEELETADERRLRLAQGYLKKLAEATRIGSRGDDGDAEGEEEGEGEGDAPSARADLRQSRSASSAAALSDEAVHSAVAQQLRDEALAAQGVLYREMSSVLARSALRCSFQEGHSVSEAVVYLSITDSRSSRHRIDVNVTSLDPPRTYAAALAPAATAHLRCRSGRRHDRVHRRKGLHPDPMGQTRCAGAREWQR